MGRDDGFTVADFASGHYDDPKVRHLWRILGPSVADMCEALTLHGATVLGSWRDGRRITVDEATPLWLPVREDLVTALTSARLLDPSRRVSARSWSAWFGPARARRNARTEAGRRGGLASGRVRANDRSSDAVAGLNPSGRQAGPSVHPTDRPSRGRTRSRRGAEPAGPESLRDAMAGTPFGEALEARRQAAGGRDV